MKLISNPHVVVNPNVVKVVLEEKENNFLMLKIPNIVLAYNDSVHLTTQMTMVTEQDEFAYLVGMSSLNARGVLLFGITGNIILPNSETPLDIRMLNVSGTQQQLYSNYAIGYYKSYIIKTKAKELEESSSDKEPADNVANNTTSNITKNKRK